MRPRSSSSTSSTLSVPPERGHGFNREQDQTLNQLLVELDGFSSGAQVVVMAASNRLQDLDPALLRPGRFDRQLLVAPPDRKGREAILHVHTRRKPLSSDVQLELIARQTSGLTGADLANIANEAAILAGRRDAKYVSALDFDNALERVVAGLQQKKVLTDKERRILAYHEAGPRAHVASDGRARPPAEGHDRLPRHRARLHAPPAERGSLPGVEGRADRHAEDRARGTRGGAGRLRARDERRRERSGEGDRDRAGDGLRVGDVGCRHVAHVARGQLRALRRDEAHARQRAVTS